MFAVFAITVRAQSKSDRLASEVTIYRDTYGVPHVFGRNDESTVFGFAYAQAEDNYWQIEENYIAALGRLSEVYGAEALSSDKLNRALEIPRLAQEEFGRLDPHTRAICDSFAAGLNYYLKRHPETKPRLLTGFEPWYPLAFIRYNYYQNGFAQDPALNGSDMATTGIDLKSSSNEGSNGWVIGPSKSATGHAMMFINPHLPFFGPGQVYEGQVHSDTGWNFTGYTRFGFPLPYVGHNENGGWVSTDNAADLTDVYIENFDDPTHALAYRYGDSYRMATEHTEEILIKTATGMETRRFKMLRTHHGPIIASKNGKQLSVRMAKFEDDGWLREWYEMTRARSLAEFKRALMPLNMLFGNVMYADRQGNTFYLYNSAVPRRDPRFDWKEPLDGSDPATEWKGYHAIDELPQLTNPKTGWMQNCNTTPFLLTSEGNPDPKNYPPYLVQDGDNPRGQASRRILGQNKKFTFSDLQRAAFDTHVVEADKRLPSMLATLKEGIKISSIEDSDRRDVRAAYDILLDWDHRSEVDSVAMTLFSLWRDKLDQRADQGDAALLPALLQALQDLRSKFGTWQVKWGEINRLQRRDERNDEHFRDDRPSLAIPGVSGRDGAVFTFYSISESGQKRRYGVAGGTYISVLEFGPTIRALTVHVFGSSGNPHDRHFSDQSYLYARGKFKPAWFTLKEIRAHLESAYHPGKEK